MRLDQHSIEFHSLQMLQDIPNPISPNSTAWETSVEEC